MYLKLKSYLYTKKSIQISELVKFTEGKELTEFKKWCKKIADKKL